MFFKKRKFEKTRESARQGDRFSQYSIGCMYRLGKGVTINAAKAVKWFTLAAEQRQPFAQYSLGVMYMDGEGVAKNKVEAVKWFRRAVTNGDPDAKSYLNVALDNQN